MHVRLVVTKIIFPLIWGGQNKCVQTTVINLLVNIDFFVNDPLGVVIYLVWDTRLKVTEAHIWRDSGETNTPTYSKSFF